LLCALCAVDLKPTGSVDFPLFALFRFDYSQSSINGDDAIPYCIGSLPLQ
jgi:hypothetical protein